MRRAVYRLCLVLFAALFAAPFAAQNAQAQSPVTLRIEWSNPGFGFGRNEGSPANFTVRFTESVSTTAALQVDWTISFPAASTSVNPAAAADFSTTTGTVSIPAGMNSTTFSITPTDEVVSEPREDYTVTLSNPRGGGAGVAPGLHATLSSANARIGSSDRVIVGWQRIGSGAVTEKNSARFRFSLLLGGVGQDIPATSGGPICIQFETSVVSQRTPNNNADSGPDLGGITDCDGNAVNVADQNSSATGGVLIPAGRQTHDFSILARFDGLDETGGNEEMVVTLTGDTERAGAGTASLTRSALRTIRVPIANFNNLHNFAFTNPVTNISEGAAATTYTVTRTGPQITGAAGLTITWAYAAGNPAPAAADFAGGVVPPGGTLVFTGMETTKTFSITTREDSLNEANERFTLTLSVASGDVAAANTEGGATLPSPVAVTIADDDPITATLSGGGNVAEGANASVTVTLSGGTPTADVTLNYRLGADADAATVNADTTADITDSGGSTFTIATTDSAPYTFSIGAVDDAINEAPEVFLVNAGTVRSAGAISTAGSPRTFTITDGDAITASIARASGQASTVDEGQAAEFTVTLTGATSGSAAPITVNYTASGTTDTPTDANSGSIQIAAGDTTGDIRLVIPRSATLVDSSPDETLTVTLGAITAGVGGGAASAASAPGNAASVTVNYLTAFHRFAFTNPVTSISEGAAATTYTVARTGPQITGAAGLTITWAYAAGSPAPAAADFAGDAVPAGGTLVFMGTDASKTFTITTKEDSLNEANERFTLTLSVAAGAHSTAATAEGGAALPSAITVTIADDDPITATLSGGGNVAEGSNATVTITLSGGTPTADVKLNYALGADADDATVNAAAADTMDGGNGTFTIRTTDSAPHTFNIAAVDDAINEAPEVFLVNVGTVSSAGAISTAGSPRTFTITDGDGITVSIAPPNPATVNEGESVDFTVSLTGAASGSVAPITVNYTVSGTTDTPTDANSGSIQIAAAGATGTIRLGIPFSSALNADSMAETLSVTLGAITVGAGGGTASAAASPGNKASVTVSYLTGAHAISFTNPVTSIAEGGSATYTVTRSGPAISSGASIELRWVYAAGSPAPAADDFMGGAVPTGGQLTFTGSETSKSFTIAIAEDTASEPGEVFTLSLSATRSVRASEGGVDLPAAISVTIGESDRPVTLRVTVPNLGVFGFFEGNSSSNKFMVSFPENVTTATAVEVDWAISFPARTSTQSSASAADFSTTSGTASIPAGQRSVDVPLNFVNENVNESDERFTITISNPAGGGAIAAPRLHATLDSVDSFIGANDASRVQFISSQRGTTARRTVSEGRSIEFEVEHIDRGGVRGISGGDICVAFDVSVLSQQTPANTAQSGPDIGGVTDCDGNAVSVSDNLGVGAGGVLIPAGQQSAKFSILARFDGLDEGAANEELIVEITGATPRVGAHLVNLYSSQFRREARARIANANYLHNFTFTSPPTSIAEGSVATITVSRAGPEIASADGITITWAYAAGSPATSASDFAGGAPSGGTLLFTGSETSETFMITAADDNLNEATERFTLALSIASADMAAANAAGRANLPNSITVALTDGDDITVRIARANGQAATVDEGQSANFTIHLNGAANGSAGQITVAYTASGTTDTPTDANGGSIQIAAGSTTGAIALGIPFSAALDDNSMDETLRVTLGAITVGTGGGAASAASAPNNAASVTVNYLSASHNFSFSNPATSINEGVDTTYTVARSGPDIPSGSSITITWAYAAGSPAPAAADFTGGLPSGGTLVFTGSETSETFSISAADDALNEATERFTLTLSIASGDLAAANIAGGANLPAAVAVAIADGDPITATLSGGGNVAEGSNASVTVTLSGGTPTADVVLNYSLGADADDATVNADTTADITDSGGGTFTIATTDTAPYTFNIAAVDDAINEAPEVFLVNASTVRSAGAISAAGSPRTFTITDGDSITVSIARASSQAATVDEGQSADFTVTLSGATGGSVANITVNYTVSSLSITPTDANSGSIEIAAGGATGGITLGIPFSQALDADSPDETLRVTLGAITVGAGGGAASAASAPNNSASVTVNYLSAAHSFTFTNPVTSISEGAAATTYTVSRTGPAIAGAAGLTITWAYTASSPAPAAADFSGDAVPAGGTLVFMGTAASRAFMITTKEDSLNEADERFTLTLSITAGAHSTAANAEGGATLPSAITVAIADDDPITATLSGGGNVAEGGNASVTVALSGGTPTADVVLNYTLSADTDTATVNADTTADLTDTDSGTFTIRTTDSAPHTFNIAAVDDAINEAPEVFLVSASTVRSAGAASVAGSPRTFTIADGDGITVSIARASSQAATVDEGQSANFTVTLNGATGGSAAAISVPYTLSSLSITPTDSNSGSIEIAAGSTTGAIALGIPFSQSLDDNSPDETLRVTLGAITVGAGGGTVSAAGSPGNSASVTVNYLSAAHNFAFTTAAANIGEGDSATYTVARTGPAIAGASGITITWAYAASSPAPAATDFAGGASPTGGTLIFTGAEDSKTFTIATRQDALNEPGEQFTLSLSIAPAHQAAANAEGGAVLPGAHSVTINDDDPIAVVITAATAVREGGNAVLNVNLGAIPTQNVRITYAAAQLTATAATNDVDATRSGMDADLGALGNGGNIDIAANANPPTGSLTIPITDDNLNEAAETFVVATAAANISGAHGTASVTSGGTQTFTIAASDDIVVSIARAGAAIVNEGQSAQFTVTLTGASGGSAADITVPYAVTSSGSYAPTDSGGGSLSIAAGLRSGTITIQMPFSTILGDSSPAQTVTVTLTVDDSTTPNMDEGPTAATGGGNVARSATPGDQSAQVTVNFLDAQHTFSFSSPASSITEGGSATYTVARTGPAIAGASGLTITWAYAASSPAPAAADFAGDAVPAGGTLVFMGTAASRTFQIATAADNLNEADERFTIALSIAAGAHSTAANAEGGATLPSAITVAIADDDPITATLSGSGNVAEGSNASVTVTLSGGTPTADVTLNYTLGADADDATVDAATADFTDSGNGTFTIATTDTAPHTFNIAAVDDAINEAPEVFLVSAAAVRSAGAISAAGSPQIFTIAASDPVTVQLARSGAGTVREGGDAEFTVSLVLAADGSTAATSAGDICAMFSTEVSQTATPAAGANPNTANNPDIEVRGCDGNLAAISATSQASGGVVISAGQSSTTLRIPVRFDDEDEGSAPETLRVALTGAAHTALSGAAALTADTTAATAMLQNVNALRSLAVSAATLTGDEDSASQPGGAAAFVDYTVGIVGADLEEAVTANWTLAAADGANLPAASALARNHGGEHEADFGRAAIAEAGGGTVNADGASGTLRFPVGAPTSRTIRVPIVQDALNEGAERLTLRVEDPCPATGVCTLGGGSSGGAPALQLSTGERAAVIPPSDPAMLRITRVGSGTVVSGEGITYEVSLGTTFLNGQSVPVRASAPLTVMVPLRVGGADSGQSFTVEVPAGQSAAQAEVPAAVLSQALSGQSGTPMLSLGMASVTGAPGPSGGTAMQMAMVVAPDPADPADSANLPAPVQTATWELTRTLPGGLEAPEGGSYEVTFALSGSDTPAGGLSFDWSVTGRTLSDGGEAAVAADFARAAGYDCGAAAVGATCTDFPSGTVTFAAGNSSQTVAIAVRDDSADNPAEGRGPGGMIRAEGFALTFTALRGTDAGRVEYAADSQLPGTPLQVTIPALRADLSVANATAAEGASAVFRLTLSGFVGGDATIQPVVVSYRVGVDAAGAALAGDTANLGADYSAPETSIIIPAGESENQSSTAIEIPLVLDGVLEPRETFTLTITGATGGGGTIRLVRDPSADPIVVADEISATGTITDDADQAARRRQRVGALVTVLDRQTALLATDAITARLSRPHAGGAQTAQLTLANRNLIGARGRAGAANATRGAGDSKLGLALYGAAGHGGVAGANAGAARFMDGSAAFGGLGAGLAGGANMGTRTALPTLAQLLNGSSFRFNAASGGFASFASGIEVWGSGGYVDLRSESRSSGLTYDGESIAAFLGADAPVTGNLFAGLAVGWSAGNLDFTDRAGGFTMRGKLENDAFSLHPYFGWQFSPHANAWLVLGIGAGSVDIEENEGSGAAAVSRKLDGGDTAMLMFSTGISGTQQIGETGDLKLRFAVTRVQSRVDSGRFDDGALLPETRGRSLRFGGEAEAGRRITFGNGFSLRPFAALRARLDRNGAEPGMETNIENEAMDWGAGITAAWSDLGLDGRFAFRRQLNDTGDEEQGVSLDLSFAPGASGQGIAIGLQASPQHTFSGEIAYGVSLRYFGHGRSDASRSALLTPYGRFHLGNANTRWAAGLRLANPRGLQLGLEAGLDLNSASASGATTPRAYDLLLTGRLNF